MSTQEELATKNEVVLDENQMICALTNKIVKVTDKELTLQSMITMLTDEYGFSLDDMERDFSVKFEDQDEGRSRTMKVSIAVFEEGRGHDVENMIRFV